MRGHLPLLRGDLPPWGDDGESFPSRPTAGAVTLMVAALVFVMAFGWLMKSLTG